MKLSRLSYFLSARLHISIHAFVFLISSICMTAVHATETGSSHNLFILNQLGNNAFFIGRANLVTREGFSDTFFGYVDGNYRHKLTSNWAIEAGYRHAFLKLGNQWREEYRPMLSLYWWGTLGEGKLSNRHRIEWRSFEGNTKDRKRYRNESVWTSLNTITDFKLTPFIEEEFFYDITNSEFNTNWITLGISKYWKKGIKIKSGYRLQSQKSNDEWENRHMLVTGISFISFK